MIQRCVKARRIFWTWHLNMRLEKRHLDRETILREAASYEIIEAYPDDKYLPSYLVFAGRGERVFHVLFAVDVAGDNVRVVTAYIPRPEKWSADLKRRKKT